MKTRRVARYSDMLEEMQKRFHADHTAVLEEKASVAKDLAATKLALQQSQIKIEREIQDKKSLEHDLDMVKERLKSQEEMKADELRRREEELAAVNDARSQCEAERSDALAEASQVGFLICIIHFYVAITE